MPKLTMLVGCPGSGKSTIATNCLLQNPSAIYVNQDTQQKGHLDIFKNAIANGYDIICDRMNHDKKQRNRYLDPAKACEYETEIIVLHVPKAVCQERCRQRKDHPTVKTEEVEAYAKERGFDMVPILYRGKFNKDVIDSLVSGDSVYCPTQKIREGVVVKKRFDYTDMKFPSSKGALKLINPEYLLKDNTDFN